MSVSVTAPELARALEKMSVPSVPDHMAKPDSGNLLTYQELAECLLVECILDRLQAKRTEKG